MDIDCIKLGFLRCNCYLVGVNNKYLLIDPGDDYNKLKEFIKNKEIIGILITHNHFDHVSSVDNLVKDYNIKDVYSVKKLKEGKISIGDFNIEVIYTFGHTMDSVTYYFYDYNVMFTGDFLFKNTIGRCDLIESDYEEMLKSIDKIKKYGDNIVVYPGHGYKTTLGYEKINNIYLNK